MPTINYMALQKQPRLFAFALLFATSTLFLASCGGGGDQAPTQTGSEKTAQAATAAATSVPGGWVGRAPRMEVINGITVPPEPAPTVNNATLAGVDVNGNGVRDDVERMIATRYPSNYSAALRYAIYISRFVTIPGATASKAEKESITCLILKKYFSDEEITSIIINTDERARVFYNNPPMIVSAECES